MRTELKYFLISTVIALHGLGCGKTSNSDGGSQSTAGTSGKGELATGGTTSVAVNCDGAIKFVDPILDLRMRELVNVPSGDLLESHLSPLTELTIKGWGVKDLSGIECFKGVTDLTIFANEVTDVTPIGRMTQLTSLYIENNAVTDLGPLKTLVNLLSLSFHYKPLKDIAAVASMTKLSSLLLYGVSLADISPVAGLTELYRFEIPNNHVTDLTPLAGKQRLRSVLLFDNQVSDLTPLPTGLESADLGKNLITDLTPLLAMKNLDDLDVTRNPLDCAAQAANIEALTAKLGSGWFESDCD